MKEETTDSLSASAVGPATLASFAPTDQKRRKEQYVCKILGMSNLKEGAM
jgi:hypothetical protein